MDIQSIELLDHPPVYSVTTFIGVADLYETLGYKVVRPSGLEDDVLRLERENSPTIIFSTHKKPNSEPKPVFYIGHPKQQLSKIQKTLGLDAGELKITDANGYEINLYELTDDIRRNVIT